MIIIQIFFIWNGVYFLLNVNLNNLFVQNEQPIFLTKVNEMRK